MIIIQLRDKRKSLVVSSLTRVPVCWKGKIMHMSVVIIILIMALLLFANYYVGMKYHKLIRIEKRTRYNVIYWVFHGVMVVIFIINFIMFFSGNHSGGITSEVEYLAAFFAGFVLYSIVLFLIRDLFVFISKFIPFHKFARRAGNTLYRGGIFVMALSSIITCYGLYNAKNYKVIDYNVTIERKQSDLESLNAVFISDAHLGCAVGAKELQTIVDKINACNPDIVFLGGDMFDDGTDNELKLQASSILGGIVSTYGTYYVIGNHECYLGDDAAQEKYFSDAGIHVIDDKVVTIDNKFILVGRKDLTGGREELSELMENVNTEELPVIMLDHEPKFGNMKEAGERGVDLQFSGHTHAGQIFPTYILNSLHIQPMYGKFKTGDMTTLVSSGVGAWAVPIRVGSPSEIMNTKILFK